MGPRLTPELLMSAYASGIFPMAESRDDPEIYWVDPRQRGVMPLDRFHISRSLRRTILRARFEIRTDTDFTGVVLGCAERPETWINADLFALYGRLHAAGRAHSVEVWEGAALVGGVYGIALGGAFFGESMFSLRTDASKVALAYLVHRLRAGGFALFDTQFITPHLRSLGAEEISRSDYRRRLRAALALDAGFHRQGAVPAPSEIVQRSIQTSNRA